MPIETKQSTDHWSRWLVLIPVSFGTAMLQGFVIEKHWLWFVVPLGLPQISLIQALGLRLIAFLLFNRLDEKRKGLESLESIEKAVFRSIGDSLFFLGLGFLLHCLEVWK